MAGTMKLPTEFWDHELVTWIGNEGAGAYARMWSYASCYRVDVVPQNVVDFLFQVDPGPLIGLEWAGLVEQRDGGYLIVSPKIFQPQGITRKRTEMLRAAPGHATKAQKQARIDFYGGLCWICRTAPYDGLDHVKPIAAGGSKWPANLRPACTPCNSSKHAKWPYEVPRGA